MYEFRFTLEVHLSKKAGNSCISHYVAPSYGRPEQGYLAHCILGKSRQPNLKWESPGSVYIWVLWNHAVEKITVVIGRILILMKSINNIVYISVSQHYREGFMEAFGFCSSKREYNWHLTTWLKCYCDEYATPLLFQRRPGSWKSGLSGLDVGSSIYWNMQEL